jgi:hypothetical protein
MMNPKGRGTLPRPFPFLATFDPISPKPGPAGTNYCGFDLGELNVILWPETTATLATRHSLETVQRVLRENTRHWISWPWEAARFTGSVSEAGFVIDVPSHHRRRATYLVALGTCEFENGWTMIQIAVRPHWSHLLVALVPIAIVLGGCVQFALAQPPRAAVGAILVGLLVAAGLLALWRWLSFPCPFRVHEFVRDLDSLLKTIKPGRTPDELARLAARAGHRSHRHWEQLRPRA